MSQPPTPSEIVAKVCVALEDCGFVIIAGLAKSIGCGRDKIIDAYDAIEAAGNALMRVRGIGGGIQFVGKQMRSAA